ncbi:MAG TPA: hypothetical protein VMU68_13630, partial [Acidimicrobiales bacterium]|nr:hypothetical protein [Acidimicrobiales bacterium]
MGGSLDMTESSRAHVVSPDAKGRETVACLEHVTKVFDGLPAVDDLSLDIFEGEFFSLLGPSG